MKPERQNIVIAEACGWRRDYFDEDSGARRYFWRNPANKNDIWSEPPNHLSSLDAMHKAEKMLTPQQQSDYHCHILALMPESMHDCTETRLWNYVHATAAQRAEAFIKAIGKWEEKS